MCSGDAVADPSLLSELPRRTLSGSRAAWRESPLVSSECITNDGGAKEDSVTVSWLGESSCPRDENDERPWSDDGSDNGAPKLVPVSACVAASKDPSMICVW